MKKAAVVLVVLAILAGILTCLFPHILFKLILGRPGRSTKIPKSYVDTPHYKVSRAGMALMKTLEQQDACITSRDGLKLHAYVFPTEDEHPKKFVVGVHGYRSYSRPEYGPYIEFYRSLGYSMLLPDDRAHAPSEGDGWWCCGLE